jgi:indole-3-acetate monooxygenase
MARPAGTFRSDRAHPSSSGISPARPRAIFATPEACVAASTSPIGRAVQLKDGYRLSGRFAWASGIHQARCVVGIDALFDGETMRKSPGGTPVVLGFVFPKEHCTVLDTWNVLGMRGTGSTEFEVNSVFVPKDMAIRFFPSECVTHLRSFVCRRPTSATITLE